QRLEPEPAVAGGKASAIARGINVRQAGPALPVDLHPVAAAGAGGGEYGGGGPHADRHQHHVRRHRTTVGKQYALGPAGAIGNSADHGVEFYAHAMGTVAVEEVVGQFSAG